jgi:membrane associated rhomboid family serine protease
MIILLPIGHEQLTLSRLPFATFALMAICIAATLLAGFAMGDEDAGDLRAFADLRGYYQEHDYLDLPPEITAELPSPDRRLYAHRQEWLAWLAEEPEEAAAFVESIPKEKRKTGVITLLNDQGEVVQKREDEGKPVVLDAEHLDALKADFLARAAAADEETRHEQQQRLDELAERYIAAAERSLTRRFAYVPAHPSLLGLVTHIFIHAGALHLVLNLVFLWVVSAKLEDIWGRPLFVAAFLVFGAIGALVHGIAHTESMVPMIGASGAVAGLMGSYVVRLGRSKVRFVYFYMILKPKVGSFDAPAFLMFPLWFFSELLYALFFDFGDIAYWAHVGGFAAGVALALAFKLTDFERRVLGREPEVEIDPDTAPLVAFQRPTAPDPADGAERSVDLTPIAIDALGEDRLLCSPATGERVEIARAQVRVIAAAQVAQAAGPLAERWLGAIPPRSGATVLLVLVVEGAGDAVEAPLEGYAIDAAELRYNRLFERPLATPRDNFFALLKRVIALYPAARFAGDRELLATGELPSYPNLEELEARLVRAST